MRKEKKNYLASLIITLFWWALLGVIVWFVDPQVMAGISYLPFLVVLFLAVLFSFSLMLGDTTNGLIVAVAVLLLGLLKIWGIGSWFNTLLVVGIVLVVVIYRWGRTKEVPKFDNTDEIV